MIKIKNVIMSVFVLIMVLYFCIGCQYSSNKSVLQTKPSEKVTKDIIIEIETSIIGKDNIVLISFDEFHINNGFFSKTKGGGDESTPYCIDVDYILKYIPPNSTRSEKIIRHNVKYTFNIRGDRWYGEVGWK